MGDEPKSMMPERSLAERCAAEEKLLGFPVSAHPLELLPPELWEGVLAAKDVEENIGRRVTMIGWMIAQKLIRTRQTPSRLMKFLSLEDLTDTFEVTLFPGAYKRFAPLTIERGPFRVRGKLEDDQGVASLNATHLEVLPLEGFREKE